MRANSVMSLRETQHGTFRIYMRRWNGWKWIFYILIFFEFNTNDRIKINLRTLRQKKVQTGLWVAAQEGLFESKKFEQNQK